MKSTAALRVLAVVVNYNAGDILRDCIGALLGQDISLEVVVLDNHSSDGSNLAAEQAFRDEPRFRICHETQNPGFAAGVNRAVACFEAESASSPDYLLIINPDCIAAKGSVSALVDAMDQHPGSGVAGPTVRDGKGQVQRATLRRFPDPWRALRTFAGLADGVDESRNLPAEAIAVDAVSGACMLLSYKLFRQLGGMDEAYVMHCEDLDLMFRAGQLDRPSLFVPSAEVVHHQGFSSRSRPAWVHWQKHRGMQRFFNKFQREQYSMPVSLLVKFGIWARFTLTLPLQWLK